MEICDVFYVSINMILSWVVVAVFPQELSFMTFLKVGFVQRAEQGNMILEKRKSFLGFRLILRFFQ